MAPRLSDFALLPPVSSAAWDPAVLVSPWPGLTVPANGSVVFGPVAATLLLVLEPEPELDPCRRPSSRSRQPLPVVGADRCPRAGAAPASRPCRCSVPVPVPVPVAPLPVVGRCRWSSRWSRPCRWPVVEPVPVGRRCRWWRRCWWSGPCRWSSRWSRPCRRSAPGAGAGHGAGGRRAGLGLGRGAPVSWDDRRRRCRRSEELVGLMTVPATGTVHVLEPVPVQVDDGLALDGARAVRERSSSRCRSCRPAAADSDRGHGSR